jgi:hypothetical protein
MDPNKVATATEVLRAIQDALRLDRPIRAATLHAEIDGELAPTATVTFFLRKEDVARLKTVTEERYDVFNVATGRWDKVRF